MYSCYGDRGGVKTFQTEGPRAQRLEMECGWKQCVLWGMGVASSHMGQVGREREMKPGRLGGGGGRGHVQHPWAPALHLCCADTQAQNCVWVRLRFQEN